MKKYIVMLSLLLTGCTVINKPEAQTPQVAITPAQHINLPSPAKLNLNLSASQIVTAEYNVKGKVKHYSSEVEVEANPQKLTLVATAGWGSALFSIVYDGVKIQSSSLPIPELETGVEHTLTDFIFAYSSTELLQSILAPTEIKLQIKPKERDFLLNNKVIINIKYQNADPWQGKVTVHNALLNYTVDIQTLKVKTNIPNAG